MFIHSYHPRLNYWTYLSLPSCWRPAALASVR
jgi:hypothetical protein